MAINVFGGYLKRVSYRDVGLKYVFSPYDKPVAYVKPGETLILEVEDAASGQIRRSEDVRDREKIPFANPVVGPIHVEGATPKDTLSIDILDIKPLIGQGATYLFNLSPLYVFGVPVHSFLDVPFRQKTIICRIHNNLVHFKDIALPYRPMIGTIGTAPHPEVDAISSSALPGRHGGNMDIPGICPNSTVQLPVFHDGGLLYVGDVHAIQGDGEISGVAVEMPAEVTLRVDLIKGKRIGWPRIVKQNELMCIATTSSDRGLEDAIRTAYFELILWMCEEFGFDRYDALMLCSQVGRIQIGNLWAVAVGISKSYLKQ